MDIERVELFLKDPMKLTSEELEYQANQLEEYLSLYNTLQRKTIGQYKKYLTYKGRYDLIEPIIKKKRREDKLKGLGIK